MSAVTRRVALLLATLSLLAAAPLSGAQAMSAAPLHAAVHRCGSGYTHASLSWGHKCLRTGQFCKRGSSPNREYRRYGFQCPRSGHLAYR